MADKPKPTTLVGPGGDEVTVESPAAVVRLRYSEGYRLKEEAKATPSEPKQAPARAAAPNPSPQPKPAEG